MKPTRAALRLPVSSIEPLENRIAPAIHIWTGPAVGGLWNNAGNWSGGVPTTGEGGGTVVQFNGGISSTDNIAGLIVNEIHFTSGGNTIFGSGVSLGLSGSVVLNNVVNDAGNNLFDSSLPIILSTATPFFLVTAGKVTVAGNISGTQGFTLNDGSDGTLTLKGLSNTYLGTTTVRDGTLELNSNGFNTAIPGTLQIGNNSGPAGSAVVRLLQGVEITDTAAVTIASDGLLDIQNFNETVASLTLQSGTNSGASVTATTGELSVGGDVTVTVSGTGLVGASISGSLKLTGASKNFNIAEGQAFSDLTVTASITNTGGFTKNGTGTLALAPVVANTYTGTVLVNDGVLFLNSAVVNGTITEGLIIGDTVGAAGSAFVVVNADNQITDTGFVSIHVDGGLLLNNVNETVNQLGLDTGTTSAATIDTGTGKLNPGSSIIVVTTGTGAVGATINGSLDFGNTTPSLLVNDGAATSDLIINAQIFGTAGYNKISTGTGALEVTNAGPTGTVQVNGGTLLLNSNGASNAIPGGLQIGSDSNVTATVRLLQPGEIGNTSTVTVRSDGVFDLNGFQDTINSLVLNSGTTSGASVTTGFGVLTIQGITSLNVTGTGAMGATISGSVNFTGNQILVSDGAAASDLTLSAFVVNNGGFTKSGAGTMEIKKSTTGPVTVFGGTLLLNSSGTNDAIQGDLIIGQSGSNTPAVVRLAQFSEIGEAVTVRVDGSGTFDLNGWNETLGSLILEQAPTNGGTVTTGAGTLTLNAGVSLVTAGAGGVAPTIAGLLSLPLGVHTFAVADGAASSDLKIAAVISGAGSFTKDGLGTLELANTANNTFAGATVIADGTLLLTAPVATNSLSESITVGNAAGGPGSAVLRTTISSVISNTAAVTVRGDGLFRFGGSESLGTITVQSGGIIDVGSSTVGSGNLSFAADGVYAGDLGGKINVTGTVALGGRLAERFTTSFNLGATVTLISNDSTDPVTGTYAGLTEGAVFGTASGLFKISYTGGDGNDVVLTFVDAANVLTIAPGGKSAKYTDVDGDIVTVVTTKGTLTPSLFDFGGIGAGLIKGYQLQKLNLTDAQFAGAKLTFVAKPSPLGGNGHVNVGSINALGRDLAGITLSGDLSQFQVGDNDAKVPGVGAFIVDSLGELGSVTLRLANPIFGTATSVGSLLVKGNVRGSNLSLGAAGTIVIGGSLIGSTVTGAGNLAAASAKKITIAGSVVSTPGTNTGHIDVIGDLGGITIGHDLLGSARIVSGGKLGPVVIGGDVVGAGAANPALISGAGSAIAPKSGFDIAITSLKIGRGAEFLNVLAGYSATGAAFSADASVGAISIGGDFRASSIIVGTATGNDGLYGTIDDTKAAFARDTATRFSKIASLIIKGQALGTTGVTSDFYSIVAEQIGSAKIGGIALKLKAGPRSAADHFALGFVSAGPGGLSSDLFLHEISA